MDSLKLVALDDEDLSVVAAHVQDAVLRLGDLRWIPGEQRLVLPMNRFVWEEAGRFWKRTFERRRAVLHFDRVRSVRSSRVPLGAKDSVLSLLTIQFVPGDLPSGELVLVLAGGGEVRLAVECIEARLTDLGAAWSTDSRPDHR